MFFAIITLITALAMATTAATFAIFGIMAVFAGAPIAALIMGTVVELGKLVGVSWIYQHWKERTTLKFMMLPAVIVAMLLTSMGIFGFLSKAHIEQNAPVGNNTAQIERLDLRIAREQAKINDAEIVIDQLDKTVSTLIEYDKISGPDGARAVRAGQQEQRDALAKTINTAEDAITEYQDEKFVLSSELRKLEIEVGPVKYLAELIYDDPENQLEDAVRTVIIAFIFVFDPMAILLLMGANFSFMKLRGKEPILDIKDESYNGPDDTDDNPGGDLINLIDDEDTKQVIIDKQNAVADKDSAPVDTVQVKPSPEEPDRAWMKNVPKKDSDISSNELIRLIQRLKNRDKTTNEQKLLARLKKLATSRNIPWDVASRARVSTINDLLKH